jgi:hypothetical protein
MKSNIPRTTPIGTDAMETILFNMYEPEKQMPNTYLFKQQPKSNMFLSEWELKEELLEADENRIT